MIRSDWNFKSRFFDINFHSLFFFSNVNSSRFIFILVEVFLFFDVESIDKQIFLFEFD